MEKQEIKKLENQFTTPKQSQRLLEVGLPASSSDCFYTETSIEGNLYWFGIHIKREYMPHTSLHAADYNCVNTLPCWSYGRLKEIFKICRLRNSRMSSLGLQGTQVEKAVYAIATFAGYNLIDFTKLEDYR